MTIIEALKKSDKIRRKCWTIPVYWKFDGNKPLRFESGGAVPVSAEEILADDWEPWEEAEEKCSQCNSLFKRRSLKKSADGWLSCEGCLREKDEEENDFPYFGSAKLCSNKIKDWLREYASDYGYVPKTHPLGRSGHVEYKPIYVEQPKPTWKCCENEQPKESGEYLLRDSNTVLGRPHAIGWYDEHDGWRMRIPGRGDRLFTTNQYEWCEIYE